MSVSEASRATVSELLQLARARELAERGRGRVSPNPLVGAVVMGGDAVLGEGWHEGPGTPHAEAMALRAAGPAAAGATVVCTLEPCSHHGRTPPCADALIRAGVARVVIGCLDPLERGRAGGAAVLGEAGVEVVLAPAGDARACRELNAPFVTHALTGRPLVMLKLAASLDGRVATATGETRWITGPDARALVHRWRAEADAVAVGIGTAIADDPLLTVRDVDGSFTPPARIVFDRLARLPASAALVRTAREAAVLAVVSAKADSARVRALAAAGVEVITVAEGGAGAIAAALDALGERGIQSLLLEGGPTLAAAFLAAAAVDRVRWFIAPILIGGDGAPAAIAGPGLGPLAGVPRLMDPTVELVGDDLLVMGALRPLAGEER